MREIGVMTSRTSVLPSARTDCRGGCGETGQPLGTGVFGQFSLAGNRVAVLHLATRVFLAGNHISNEKSTREEATKFEKFKQRRGRENINENQRKAERNRARDKALFTKISFQVTLLSRLTF